MGVTKQYLRYVSGGFCGLVGSQSSNVVFIDGKTCAVGAAEDVYFWDIRKGEKTLVLHGEKSPVSIIKLSRERKWIAVGYADGLIRLWQRAGSGSYAPYSYGLNEEPLIFSGHRSGVSCFAFDDSDLRLASGGKDGVIILWDIVNEAGLVRLTGHKSAITQCRFIHGRNLLMSSGKDSFIKFWELSSHHCVYTLLGHRTEIWDFVLFRNGTKLVTGTSESELKVYNVDYITDNLSASDAINAETKKLKLDDDTKPPSVDDQDSNVLTCTYQGSLLRRTKGRTTGIYLSSDEKILLCTGTGLYVEAWRVQTEEEVRLAVRKKLKKLRKRNAESGNNTTIEPGESDLMQEIATQFVHCGEQRLDAKIKAIDIWTPKADAYSMVILQANNSLKYGTAAVSKKEWTFTENGCISMPGHRTDIRTLSFSSENSAFITGSSDSVKVWNRNSLSCVRTMACTDALSSLLVAGDRHVVIGNKKGELVLYDIASGTIVETVQAHDGPAWDLSSTHDQTGLASGSGDKSVKFWNFELVSDNDEKRLSLIHTRTLQLPDEVMCLKFSDSGKFIAVGLLDNTIKVFFVDTLKFFLTMYGHSLPVLCIDISSDSSILVSGSADKNVKIWGMDFGDCHRSLFAHDDSITRVRFVPKTHLFFSCGKDGKIKQWDADNFEKIQTLEGHHSEIWSLAISPNGMFVASAAHDKTIRIWEKSLEPIILQEEQEMEREEDCEKGIEEQEDVVAGETITEAGLAGKKTIETVKSTESIIEALDICRSETQQMEEEPEGKEHQYHPLMMAYKSETLDRFVVDVIKRIRSNSLEKALLLLPFSFVMDLFGFVSTALETSYETELCCRCIFFLMRIHHNQLVNSPEALHHVERLSKVTKAKITTLRDTVGFNLAAFKFFQQELNEKEDVQLFYDASQKQKERRKKKEHREQQAFILSV